MIYFTTLYHVFSEFLGDLSENELPDEKVGFKKSKIWNMLYDFQRDAVLAIINKLEKYNSCILTSSSCSTALPSHARADTSRNIMTRTPLANSPHA